MGSNSCGVWASSDRQPVDQHQTTRSLLQVPVRLSYNLVPHPAILVPPHLICGYLTSGFGSLPHWESQRKVRRSEAVRASISLGRIAGIKVGINASVFLIIAILVVGLATGQLPAAYPGRSIVAYVIAAIIAAVLFLASLLAHELAHSLVARRNGIEVESIVLWLLGGVAQLRGEPKTPGADFRIAIVGPLTSLVLAIVFGLAAAGVASLGGAGLPFGVLIYLAATNAVLAVFNLIPAAPLDGGRVLRAALWRSRGDRHTAAVNAARAGRILGFVMIALGVLQVVTGRGLGGVWLALIGWFVVSAATAEEQQARLGGRLAGLTVGQVMAARPPSSMATSPWPTSWPRWPSLIGTPHIHSLIRTGGSLGWSPSTGYAQCRPNFGHHPSTGDRLPAGRGPHCPS